MLAQKLKDRVQAISEILWKLDDGIAPHDAVGQLELLTCVSKYSTIAYIHTC